MAVNEKSNELLNDISTLKNHVGALIEAVEPVKVLAHESGAKNTALNLQNVQDSLKNQKLILGSLEAMYQDIIAVEVPAKVVTPPVDKI